MNKDLEKQSGLHLPRLLGPVIETLRELGGAAKPKKVFNMLEKSQVVSEEDLKATLKNGNSKFENYVQWARFYLAEAGLIDKQIRGYWRLTPQGRETHLNYDSSITLIREVKKVLEERKHVKTFNEDSTEDTPPPPEEYTHTEEIEFEPKPYGISDILNDGCFLSEEDLKSAYSRLREKKNLILQGPPGTGKTWLARRLGYVLIGTKDRKRMRETQFHPSTSYEDFIRGYRPNKEGKLELIDGVFLKSFEAAHDEPDRPLVVIIEEINRGNPVQIFGEMLTLLEKDKRRNDEAVKLSYGPDDERIFIPDNLYVIGTMNIADRSLALVDFALRRRFAFKSLEPIFNETWLQWCIKKSGMDKEILSRIQERMSRLNEKIAEDRTLGEQFKIGHSYVTPTPDERVLNTWTWFTEIVETEIAPLLEEYWFDNPGEAASSKKNLLQDL